MDIGPPGLVARCMPDRGRPPIQQEVSRRTTTESPSELEIAWLGIAVRPLQTNYSNQELLVCCYVSWPEGVLPFPFACLLLRRMESR